MENKYQNGKIYKIVSLSNPELVYFGSTTQKLSMRMAMHRAHYRKGKSCSSHIVIEKGDAIILLVESYPCKSREQLCKKEGQYILSNQCVNKNAAWTDQLEYQRKHYEENKERIQERHKKYNSYNAERIKEYQKLYREKRKLNINKLV